MQKECKGCFSNHRICVCVCACARLCLRMRVCVYICLFYIREFLRQSSAKEEKRKLLHEKISRTYTGPSI